MTDITQTANLANIGKQALIDLLNNLTQAKQFVLDQAPDVCQQYVALGRFQCTVSFIGVLLLGLFLWRFPLYVRRIYKTALAENSRTDEVGYVMLGLWPTLAASIMSVFLMAYSWSLVSAWIAPKVYLIQAITELVK